MSTRQDTVQIRVEMDASQGIQEMGKLENIQRQLVQDLKDLKRGTEAYKEASDKLAETNEQIKDLRKELGLTGLTMRQLRQYQQELKREWDNTTAGTERFQELDTKLKEVSATIQAQANRLRETGTDWEKLRAEVGLAGMTMNQLLAYQKELNQAMANTPSTAATFEAQAAELRNVGASIDSLRAKTTQVGPSMEHVAQAVGVAGMSMNELVQYQRELTADWNKIPQGTAEYEKLNERLNEVNQTISEQKARLDTVPGAMGKIKDEVGLAGMSMNQLTQYQKELTAEWKNSVAGTEKYRELDGALKEVTETIDVQNGKLGKFAQAWSNAKEEMLSMGLQGAVVGGLVAVGAAMVTVITKSGELADQLGEVQKTTGMSELEVNNLNQQLSKVDTRTARDELRSIAAVAGQLGIANDQVLEFVKATDKLNVALGDEIKGGAEEVTRVMGGLRNVMSDIKTEDVSADMLHIGNALNVLAAEGAATAPVVADIANRIGGVGMVMGLTSGQTLGLAATMQELNITAERGSTAVVKILQHMAAQPEKFAAVTKLNAAEFRKLVDTDIYGALKQVMEGAAGSASGATKLASTLDALGVDGAGASEVIAKMGTNITMLDTKSQHATKSLGETKSILNEFGTVNNNFAGQLERVSKWWNGLFTAQTFQPLLQGVVSLLDKLVSTRSELDLMTEAWEKQGEAVQELEKTTAPMLDRYDELAGKTNRNKQEQEELDKIIAQVAETIPTAVTEFDKYGKALGINTQLAKAFIQQQKDSLEYLNRDTLAKARQELKGIQQEIKEYQGMLNQVNAKGEHVHTDVSDSGYSVEIKNTEADMREWMAHLNQLTLDARRAEAAIAKLSGEETDAVKNAKKLAASGAEDMAEALGFIAQIEAKIKELKQKQQDVGKDKGDDPAEVARIQKQIDYQEELKQKLLGKWKDKAAAKAAKDKAKEAADRQKEHDALLAEFYKFQEAVHKAQEKVNMDQLSADERELQQVDQKYDELLDKAVDYANNTILTANEREQALREIDIINDTWRMDRVNTKARQDKRRREIEYQNAVDELQAEQALRVLLAQQDVESAAGVDGSGVGSQAFNQARVKLEAAQVQQIVSLRELQLAEVDKIREKDLLSEQQVAKRKELINADADDRIKQIHKKTAEEIRLENLRQIGESFQRAGQLGSEFLGMAAKYTDNQDKKEQKEHKKKLKVLDDQLSNKLISEKEYNVKKDALEQEYEQKASLRQQEQAQIQKIANVFQATMNGGVAVTKALAEGGPFAGPALAALIGAMTAAQIALILAEPIPAFMNGGFTKEEAMALPHQNLSRSSGGLMKSGPFLATVNEVGPEYFVPNWLLSDPQAQPHVKALEALRTGNSPGFAAGGQTSTGTATATWSTPTSTASPAAQQPMTEATGQLMVWHLAQLNQAWQDGKVIQAEVVSEQQARADYLQKQRRKDASF
jgi:TP901 family phage tail tape measure protein